MTEYPGGQFPCEDEDCSDCTTVGGERHFYPAAGTRVRVIGDVETREPGDDDCKPIAVRAGEEGVVAGYVPEWFDVHVALITQDGQDVWITPDNLEVIQ